MAVLRARTLPYARAFRQIERQFEQPPPDQHPVALSLTDDVFLRSFDWAHLQLGIPLPNEE
jgi:hypothetical protein